MEKELSDIMMWKESILAQLEHRLGTMQEFPTLALHPKLSSLEQHHFLTVGIYYLKRDVALYPITFGANDITY